MVRPIEKINRDGVANQVFNDLKARVLAGEFQAGQKLPAEHTLSENYGVSRASVRAALQKLGTLGLVESRVGEGTFVRDGSFESLMREVSALVAQESMTPYVAEFRELIENASITLAVERATDAELDEFGELAKELVEVAATGDVNKYLGYDYEFHLALCKLSHNPLFEMVYSSIRDLFRLGIRANLDTTAETFPDALPVSARVHLDLSQALRNRDEQGARAIIDAIVNLSRPGADAAAVASESSSTASRTPTAPR
ncbi:FadR/GntR family transcriptional regulator [Nocardioides sp. NPDC006303]|uniref:FadR/GntR family transcriptional regulator n=1 Tax=Nocardioides sp. NPDC006303 TaxID=3156747 RepID=UPI0033BAC9FD